MKLMGILLFAFLLGFGVMYVWTQQPTVSSSDSHLPQVHLTGSAACKLGPQVCKASNAQQQVISLQLSPAEIPLMTDLQVDVTTQGISDIQQAKMVVEGVNMYMGYQRVDLNVIAQGKLEGTLVLPICSQSHMQWKAVLSIRTNTSEYITEFPFETNR